MHGQTHVQTLTNPLTLCWPHFAARSHPLLYSPNDCRSAAANRGEQGAAGDAAVTGAAAGRCGGGGAAAAGREEQEQLLWGLHWTQGPVVAVKAVSAFVAAARCGRVACWTQACTCGVLLWLLGCECDLCMLVIWAWCTHSDAGFTCTCGDGVDAVGVVVIVL